MPAVSVILPTYNRQATLSRAVQSVLAQSFADFELIVVDDASTDGTRALLGGIEDPRLRVVALEHNRGAAAARNAGIAAARAAWLAFQDSDDEWIETKLQQQWALACNTPAEVGLILGGYLIDAQPRPVEIRPRHTLAGECAQPDILDGWPIITPTWLVRRELLLELGGFDESYPCLEDWDLVFRLSDRCTLRAVPGPVLIKHGSLNSVCADPARLCGALDRILQSHPHRWSGEPRRLARRLTHLACLQYRLGRRTEARATLGRAVAHDPGSPVGYLLLAASLAGRRAMSVVERLWPRYAGMAP